MTGENATPSESPTLIQAYWCSVAITKKMEDVLIGNIIGNSQKGLNVSEYHVYLSTVGGSPFSAITLYNFFKALPQKTVVYNMGMVASAGVPFFLAFDERIGAPDCSFLVHQTSVPSNSMPANVNVSDLELQKDQLEATDQSTQALILKETAPRATTPLTKKNIGEAFRSSQVYSAETAKKVGFIDRIESPVVPSTNIIYITDQFLSTLSG